MAAVHELGRTTPPADVEGACDEVEVVDTALWVEPFDVHAAATSNAAAEAAKRAQVIAPHGTDRLVRDRPCGGSRWVNSVSSASIVAMAPPHIVVIEDDTGIGSSLERTLAGQGFETTWATNAQDGLAAIRATTALVILDLGLPDIDGLDVCRQIRNAALGPQVLILTARGDEADVVLGLDAGADDYLVKPFRLAELLARVRACTRRVEGDRARIVIGDLDIDVDAHTLRVAEAEVDLRPKEFDLLVALARNAGRVVTRERLLDDVWDENWYGSTKTLDIHIWALRRKLDPTGGPSRISTVRGVGYRLENA